MKRWYVAILVALAVLLMIAPGVIGHLAERNIDASLKRLDAENESFRIRPEAFERGWFTSAGRHRIELTSGPLAELFASPGAPVPALIIDTRVDHGIVPVTSIQREEGSLTPALANAVSTIALDSGGETRTLPGALYSFVGLNGKGSYRLVLEPGSAGDDDASAAWPAADMVWSETADGRRRELDAIVDSGARFESDGLEATLGALNLAGFIDRRDHPAGTGQLEFNLESLALDDASDGPSSFGPIRLSASQDVDDGRASGELKGDLDAEVAMLGGFGSDIDMTWSDFDADRVAALVAAFKAARENAGGYEPSLMDFDAELRALAAGGGRIDIERLGIRFPEGESVTRVAVGLEAAETAPGAAAEWPSILLRSTATIEVSTSEGLFERLASENPGLRSMVAGGFLVKRGDRFDITIELDDGRLTVNGAPMPLEALLNQRR